MIAATAHSADFRYLADEASLSRELGIRIVDTLRLFSLRGLGIDQDRFIGELGPTFAQLPWDTYDLKLDQTHFLVRCFPREKKRLDDFYDDYHLGRVTLEAVTDLIERLSPEKRRQFDALEPFRRRSISKFELRYDPTDGWSARRVPAKTFAQDVEDEDYRSLKRVFAESTEYVTSHSEFQKLLVALAQMVGGQRAGAKMLSVTMHQVSIVADSDTLGDNSPEGIHQDGADFIISALVVARQGITGGQSVVYGPDRETEYLRIELEPGQGIFQEDKGSTLWHDVTPVRLRRDAESEEGNRDIFGFDVDVVE